MDDSIKTKVSYEISQIDDLIDKSKPLLSLCKIREPDFIEITAVGGILHSFYNGIENIFVLLGKSLNFDFKTSPQWHRNLVDCMFAQPDSRPIISSLKDIFLFKDFCIKNHTVSWSSGLDFAPEFIKDCSIIVLNESA